MSRTSHEKRRAARLGGLAGAALVLTGCASVTGFRGVAIEDEALYVAGVPLVRQDRDYACGAACVAAVASYWGQDLHAFRRHHPRLLIDATGAELQRVAESLGLRAFAYRGSMDDLLDNLRQGRPVIVMIPKPELMPAAGLMRPVLELWNAVGLRAAHWVVAVGTIEGKGVILNDPASGALVVPRRTFERWWEQKDHLSVLIVASDPVGASGRKRAASR